MRIFVVLIRFYFVTLCAYMLYPRRFCWQYSSLEGFLFLRSRPNLLSASYSLPAFQVTWSAPLCNTSGLEHPRFEAARNKSLLECDLHYTEPAMMIELGQPSVAPGQLLDTRNSSACLLRGCTFPLLLNLWAAETRKKPIRVN